MVTLLTRRRLFLCRRCGWQARRAWSDNHDLDRGQSALDPTSSYDPSLVDLDQADSAQHATSENTELNLAAIDRLGPTGELPVVTTENPRSQPKRRRKPSAVSAALIILVLVMVGLIVGMSNN